MATLPNLANVADTIGAGNFASKLASTTGGTSSITTALNSMALPNVSSLTSGLPNVSSLTSGLPNLTGAGGLPNLTDLTSKIPKIPPGLPGVDALKDIKPPDLTSSSGLLDATKGVSGSAFSAISSSFKALKPGVPQNLTAIDLKNKMDQAAADTKAAALPSAKSLTDGLNTAGVDLKTGKIPGVDAAVAAGGIGAGADALKSTLSKVPGMSTLSTINTSTLASGITNLPGGQSAAASLINSSTGSTTGISDTLGGLNTITKNASSSALNSISSAAAGSSAAANLLTGSALTGAGSNLISKISNPAGLLPTTPSIDSLTKGLQTGKQPLSALATIGLSGAAAAALAASMNSISTSSPNPIKMPTVAAATVDRSELSGQVTNLLGDKKIPAPNYNPTPPVPSPIAAELTAKRSEFITKKIAYDEELIARKAALEPEKQKYIAIRDSLPKGDPVREAARQEVNAKIIAFTEWSSIEVDKLNALQAEINQLAKSQ
jgi:hypothetical protein